jgi:hypothetical protein
MNRKQWMALSRMFHRGANRYADIAARFAGNAPIPRLVYQFFQRYADRVPFATDMAFLQRRLSATYRILESNDEHFYEQDLNLNLDYHRPFCGLGLLDALLGKVDRDSAVRAPQQARQV